MAKRSTGIEKNKQSRSKKTKKRIEIKLTMLAARKAKKKGGKK
jgi:ribosomal protein L32